MARILLSAIVTEIRGKIGGTVFQSGQGGFQAKRLVQPRDPSIPVQRTRRNSFLAATNDWGGLTLTQRNTWVGSPDPGLSPYTTYVRKNAIMRFYGQSPFSTNPGTSSAATMDLRDTTISSSAFVLTGRAPFNALPAGQMIAITASRLASPGKSAFSPSEFVLITLLTGAHDYLASPVDITTAYVAKFGPLVTGRLLQFRANTLITATGNTQFNPQGSFIVQ